jgi:hypothetical protein
MRDDTGIGQAASWKFRAGDLTHTNDVASLLD